MDVSRATKNVESQRVLGTNTCTHTHTHTHSLFYFTSTPLLRAHFSHIVEFLCVWLIGKLHKFDINSGVNATFPAWGMVGVL